MGFSWWLPLLRMWILYQGWSWTGLPWEMLLCLLDLDKVFGEVVGGVLVVMGFGKLERADNQ